MLCDTLRKGQLIVVSAPSGAGKTTLCKMLLAEYKTLSFSVSYTTREPRPGETDGREYHFTDESAFRERIAQGDFLEYATVHGKLYGTSKSAVIRQLETGDVLLDIDPQGAMQLRDAVDHGVFVFIVPPSFDELRARIEKRGNTEGIDLRLANARKEIKYIPSYDYVVVIDDLREAYRQLAAIYTASRMSTRLINDYERVVK